MCDYKVYSDDNPSAGCPVYRSCTTYFSGKISLENPKDKNKKSIDRSLQN